MSKIMVGYHGWGMERMPMNDASVQLLADGVKWTGYASGPHVTWNVGAFGDWLSEEQSFSIADRQFIGRLVWQPILSDDGGQPPAPRRRRCDTRSPTTVSCSRGRGPKLHGAVLRGHRKVRGEVHQR